MTELNRLNRKFLSEEFKATDNLTVGSLEPFPERIIQFGEGNFLRAFVDWMVDAMNSEGLFKGRVAVAQPIKSGVGHLLTEQDGLYTLLLRGIQNGQPIEKRQIITAVSRGLSCYENWNDVLEIARDPNVRYMFSNTTEAGITYRDEPFQSDNHATPETFPAKVARYLYERYNAFNADPEKGMVIIPCELIDRNGDNLRKHVLTYAAKWELEPAFAQWIEQHCHFLNTLVDRIVPGYPRETAEQLVTELGYDDQLIDTGEIFHLWVIEGPQELAQELPFHKAGLNVVWTDDMTPYRTRKVRMLNGAHTSSVLAGYLGGLDTVGEMLTDQTFNAFLRTTLADEILQVLPGDADSNRSFAEGVLERFGNPYIRHELLSISLNSVSKWKVRVLPSLTEYVELRGALPKCLTFSLAALIAFYRGTNCAGPELRGQRNGTAYAIRDDEDVLTFFVERWSAFEDDHDTRALVETVLANDALWDQDLTRIPGFVDATTTNLQEIITAGSRAAVERLVAS